MHRRTIRRSLIAAAILTTLPLLSGHAPAEPNGGTLSTNNNIEIKLAVPADPASAESVPPAVTSPLDHSDAADEPVADAHDPDADHDPNAATEAASNELRPLVDAKTAEREIALSMSAQQSGPVSDSGEQSMGLMNPDEDARSSSWLGMLPGGDNDFIQVIGALAIVITLLLVFRLVVVRASGALAGSRPSGVLEILARYPVARGQHLSLIKLGRRILLVHQNGSAMNTLSEVSDPDEVAAMLSRIEAGSSGRDAERFRSLLRQFQREHHAAGAHAGAQRGGLQDSTRDEQGEVVDLTRSQMGGLRNLFGYSGDKP